MLSEANLRLHKIASNSPTVTQAFAAEDQASDLRNLDFHRDTIPIQRSLGVSQDLRTDTFTLTKLNYSRDVGSCPQPIASRDRCSRSHQS